MLIAGIWFGCRKQGEKQRKCLGIAKGKTVRSGIEKGGKQASIKQTANLRLRRL